MPDAKKKYGPHKYPDHDGTSDCEFGCGCSTGPFTSSGPLGLDPLYGFCPNNPENGFLLGGKADYEEVVNARILDLQSRASKAEDALRKVRPSKKKLADDLAAARQELLRMDVALRQIHEIALPYEKK